MDNYSEDFKKWMDERNLTSKNLAPMIKKGEQTLNNWRSQGVPIRESVRSHITSFMEDYDAKKVAELEMMDVINLEVSPERFDTWNQAALDKGLIMRDWAIEGLDQLAKEVLSNVTPLPKKKAHLMAAAGAEIDAELIDWEEGSKELNVRIIGDSLSPLYQDGDIVSMAPRHLAKRTELAKGKFYLFRTKDGLKIKRYNTRKARPDENEAEYLTKNGTVGVFESFNSKNHDPIDITDTEVQWLAWLEKDGSYPKDL